jgi:nicotinate-nucleotide pyrophosphorylase (carboxylating)
MIDNNLPHEVKKQVDAFIQNALIEDVGSGDHSTLACIPKEQTSNATLFVKEDCIIAGIDLARYIFTSQDENLIFNQILSDGQRVSKGNIAFGIEGATHTILKLERLVLNCMQRMSGIATKTNDIQSLINHTKCKLLDTRKTTPGIRFLEKWAVRIGGGVNHRIGLYDMVMLKDNHIDAAGGITKAIQSTKKYLSDNNLDLKIEVETRNLKEVEEVLSIGGIDRIMLDNFTIHTINDALELIQGKYEVEASGGITADNIVEYAETGVDFISTSQITHSVKSIDLSLKISK